LPFSSKGLGFTVKHFLIDNAPICQTTRESFVVGIVLAQALGKFITSVAYVVFVKGFGE
jgi:hypothetical protein